MDELPADDTTIVEVDVEVVVTQKVYDSPAAVAVRLVAPVAEVGALAPVAVYWALVRIFAPPPVEVTETAASAAVATTKRSAVPVVFPSVDQALVNESEAGTLMVLAADELIPASPLPPVTVTANAAPDAGAATSADRASAAAEATAISFLDI